MKVSDKMKTAYASMKEGKMTGSKMASKIPVPKFEDWLKSQGITLDGNGDYTTPANKKFSNAQLRAIHEDNFTDNKYIKDNEDGSKTDTGIRAIDAIHSVADIGGSSIVRYRGADQQSDGTWKLNDTVTQRKGANDKVATVAKQTGGEDALDSPFMGAKTKQTMNYAAKNYGSKSPQKKAAQKQVQQIAKLKKKR